MARRSSTVASGDYPGEPQWGEQLIDAQWRRQMLEKTIEECENEECALNPDAETEGEEEEGVKDERLQKDGLHTTIFNWLVHRMPGQARQKLPRIVANETDNKSCWALVRLPYLSATPRSWRREQTVPCCAVSFFIPLYGIHLVV